MTTRVVTVIKLLLLLFFLLLIIFVITQRGKLKGNRSRRIDEFHHEFIKDTRQIDSTRLI
tara:strand:+ start:1047 stop:1226 length:180 start_codon:yes stop_codon:yes gene_type:complete